MQFNSFDYLLFFPIVLCVYFFIPRKLREIWLLLASYYFYMSWNVKYVVLIGFSTVVTYLGGLFIERISKSEAENAPKKAKLVLILTIVVNLAILALFKYANFAINSINKVASLVGGRSFDFAFDFLLPVGISFYTFQALGYIIDVYRKDIPAERNFIRYALFVSFFPQLVAGPIERSKNLLTQLKGVKEKNLWNAEHISNGFIMIIWGLFLKMVISDRVAILVDNVFDNYRMFGSTELIMAAIGFSLQIYCDFYSYSIIAKGSACMMGIELMENFNSPYFSVSIKDFWNRWHISLSTWFRDYLYIPLGGNRKGKFRKYVNLLIVFLVSGLWHGASWHYVVWGGIHGFYQIVGGLTQKPREFLRKKLEINTNCFSWNLLQSSANFVLIAFAWIFFRAESVGKGIQFCKRIFIKPTPWLLFNGGIFNLGLDRVEMNILVVSVIILLLVDLLKYKRNQTLETFLFTQNTWFRWSVLIMLILFIFVFGEYGPLFDPKQFIYFQF